MSIKGRKQNESTDWGKCLSLPSTGYGPATGVPSDIVMHVTLSFITLLWNKLHVQQSLILNFWCDCLQLALMMHRFQRNANLQVTQKVMMMRMTTLQTMKCHRARLQLTSICVIQKMKTTVKIQTVCEAHVWFICSLCCAMFGAEFFGSLIRWKFDAQIDYLRSKLVSIVLGMSTFVLFAFIYMADISSFSNRI